MGPNCLGVVYAGDGKHPGLNTFFIPEEKFKVDLSRERNVAILSQSGAMGIMELFNLRNAISPKVVVSYGNQLDVDPADLVQYFEDDPMVEVIGLYIEGFKQGAGRRFFEVTSRCRKPIIVYKAGRTEAGRQAAQSHTASIAGEYEVAKAAMKQAGLIVAGSMIAHGDFVKTFALLADFQVAGRRVAVIANAGYEKTSAADNLGELELAELDSPTLERLREHIPPMVEPGPLLDLTAMISDEQFERCIDVMLESSPRVDALCISILPQAQVLHTTDQEIEHYEKNIAARIVATVHKHKKPTVVSVNVVSGLRRGLQPLRPGHGLRRGAHLPHRRAGHGLPERVHPLPPDQGEAGDQRVAALKAAAAAPAGLGSCSPALPATWAAACWPPWSRRAAGALPGAPAGIPPGAGRRGNRGGAGDVFDEAALRQALEQDRLLRLAAEMRVPGRAWLQFEVSPAPGGCRLRQTAIFDPVGLAGLLYWYVLTPLHGLIFAGMIRGITRAALSEAPGE